MARHRAGIDPGFLTSNTLDLCGATPDMLTSIGTELEQLPYVDHVSTDGKRQKLKIAYEASRHSIDEIIEIVTKHGASTSNSWWSRTKLDWARQIDRNIRENAEHEPHCCNKIPRP